jgi:hypothetical protein
MILKNHYKFVGNQTTSTNNMQYIKCFGRDPVSNIKKVIVNVKKINRGAHVVRFVD